MARVVALAAVLITACSPAPSPRGSPAAPDGDFPNPPPAVQAAWSTLEQKQSILGGIFGGEGSQFVTGAIAFADGFIVIGYTVESDQHVTGRIWMSPNGVDWSAVDDPGAGLDDAQVSWIATDGQKLIAIGAKRGAGALRPQPVVWSSPDGRTWRRVADSPAALADGVRGIVGQAGAFLAIGATAEGTSRLLRTTDGVDWTATDSTAFGGDEVLSVEPYRGGWLAVGSAARTTDPAPGGRPQRARAWWSVDGLRWDRATVADGPQLTGIHPGAAAILGLGSSDCGGCVANANLWQSDGKTWRLLGPDRLLWPAYASDGSRIVVWDNQGSGAFGWSSNGIAWTPFGEPLKDGRAYGALVVGSKGLLLPLRNNAEPADAGVLYLEAG